MDVSEKAKERREKNQVGWKEERKKKKINEYESEKRNERREKN